MQEHVGEDAGAPALRDVLRAGTAQLHARLEHRLKIDDPQLSLTRYRRLLQALWGFYGPLEHQLRQVPIAPMSDRDVERTTWLGRDLQELGLSRTIIEALPCCPSQPITGVSDAFGRLYVIEGAMLGGQIITRHLSRTLNLSATRGALFFSGYGSATGNRWRQFLRQLEQAWQDGQVDAPTALASARELFANMEAWLEARGVLQ